MPESSNSLEALIWTDAQRASLAAEVVERMDGVRVLAVGGPRKGQLGDLGQRLNVKVEDDLRKMLIEQPAAYLMLATEAGVSRADLEHANEAGTMILAIEPPGAQVMTAEAFNPSVGRSGVIITPWWRMSPAWTAAADPMQALGAVQSVQITQWCSYQTASLYARLYDAMDMLTTLLGVGEMIDAALSGGLPGMTEPPDDVRSMTGHLTAHVRYAGGATASIQISDRCSIWQRRLAVIGAEGQLLLDEGGYQLFSAEGRELDSKSIPLRIGTDPVAVIVDQWKRLIDDRPLPAPADPRSIFAACAAALLSCRTGEGESLQTQLQLQG